jgi:hypothetical protein
MTTAINRRMSSKRETRVKAGQRVGLQVRRSDMDDSPRRLSSVSSANGSVGAAWIFS